MVTITKQAGPGAAVSVSRENGKQIPILRRVRRSVVAGLCGLTLFSAGMVQAQETVCARVKIEVKQELTLER